MIRPNNRLQVRCRACGRFIEIPIPNNIRTIRTRLIVIPITNQVLQQLIGIAATKCQGSRSCLICDTMYKSFCSAGARFLALVHKPQSIHYLLFLLIIFSKVGPLVLFTWKRTKQLCLPILPRMKYSMQALIPSFGQTLQLLPSENSEMSCGSFIPPVH